jgi:hypothetical protein
VNNPRKCTDPTHVQRRNGKGCATCELAAQRARRRRVRDGEIAITGDKGHQRAWITRRARYGKSGYTPQGLASVTTQFAVAALQGNANAQKTHCKRGHPFTPQNTLRTTQGRVCRACKALRERGRPTWVDHQGVRVSIAAHDTFYRARHAQLRQAMVVAHPDAGGTAKRFIAARKAQQAFEAEEQRWYAVYGLKPPTRRSRRRRAV